MTHEPFFNDFLDNHVNLNKSRLEILESRVETINGLLKDRLEDYRKYSTQGSYAHRTIIKPVQDNDKFDADILVFIKDDDFDPDNFVTNYVGKIHDIFKNDGNYRDKIEPNTRCVAIKYAGDFRLDIVPCVEHNDTNYICNSRDKQYEKTDGDGYKKWLADKNRVVKGNNLKKVTRLLKFLRDHKDNFSVKSILLTTLLGNQIGVTESSDDFSDIPTALKTISNRLNDFLQRHPRMPIIENPVLPDEKFTRHWDQEKYTNFRNKFYIYNTRINEAFEEANHNASVRKWRKLFGDDFGNLMMGKSVAVVGGITLPTVVATRPYAHND